MVAFLLEDLRQLVQVASLADAAMTALRGGDYLSRLSEVPSGMPRLLPRRGYGFFSSPNHLRILAIRLAIGQLYDDPRCFANGFAKPSQMGGGGDHLS